MKKVKHNKYALKIDAELDLHGFTRGEAQQALEDFLQHSEDQGFKRIRIITGKGLHSKGVPILKAMVSSHLKKQGYHFSRSKISEGDTGAFEVRI
jgi:DNA-nicking Smr family endonuclease